MSEQKRCIRCERPIDRWSKLCPFCNWDQNDLNPPPVKPVQQAAPVNPENELKEQLKKKGLYASAGVLILILSFLIGMVINSDDAAPEDAPPPLDQQAQSAKVPPIKRADTPLVPTNERGGLEQPITSAPASTAPEAMSNGYDRSDATAVSSDEYNQLARRAKAEKERMSMIIDPRTLTGAAYAQGQRMPARRPPPQQVAQALPPPMPGTAPQGPIALPPLPEPSSAPAVEAPRVRRAIRTRPVPEYQPIPRIYARGTARLSLIIGPDGRVKDINIEKALDRNTADLVAAVAKWRFRPATEDGEPVSAPYSVDISFGGR